MNYWLICDEIETKFPLGQKVRIIGTNPYYAHYKVGTVIDHDFETQQVCVFSLYNMMVPDGLWFKYTDLHAL